MKNIKLSIVIITSLILVFVFACDKEEKELNNIANFNVLLTDAPADYDAVNIDIREVLIHYSDNENDTAEWVTLENMNSGIYNLLNFSNGLDTSLANTEIPTGTLSQIRLVLGQNNTLVVDGVSYDLETPSAEQSGLKLNFGAKIQEGLSYSVWLDFDASRSIVENGNDKYHLKPVIRAYAEAQDGAIKGVVYPVEAQPVVMAIMNEDTASTYSDNGNFFLKGLEAGTYTVVFKPIEGYQEVTLTDVEVVLGDVTELDSVFLAN